MHYNVYLITAIINGSKLYKIGYTRRDVSKRIKELKTGNAADFKLIKIFSSKWGAKIEAYLHKYFKNKKINGEWFDLNLEDINNFTNMCENIDNNLENISINNTYYLSKNKFY